MGLRVCPGRKTGDRRLSLQPVGTGDVGEGSSGQIVSSAVFRSRARILRVALGKHNLRTREATQQVLRVARQVPHPQYDSRTHDNDLMLLRLERPARLGRAVRPIAVAQTCTSPGTLCRVSGWGTTSSPIGEDACALGTRDWVRGIHVGA